MRSRLPLIAGNEQEPYLGILLRYDSERPLESRFAVASRKSTQRVPEKTVRIGMIGAATTHKNSCCKLSGGCADFHSWQPHLDHCAQVAMSMDSVRVSSADEVLRTRK